MSQSVACHSFTYDFELETRGYYSAVNPCLKSHQYLEFSILKAVFEGAQADGFKMENSWYVHSGGLVLRDSRWE